jgi:hypothetical protein
MLFLSCFRSRSCIALRSLLDAWLFAHTTWRCIVRDVAHMAILIECYVIGGIGGWWYFINLLTMCDQRFFLGWQLNRFTHLWGNHRVSWHLLLRTSSIWDEGLVGWIEVTLQNFRFRFAHFNAEAATLFLRLFIWRKKDVHIRSLLNRTH